MCREFQDQIAAAVDRCLPNDQMESFSGHVRQCPPCRAEYELELATKQCVRDRARLVHTPLTVARAIIERLATEDSSLASSQRRWWTGFLKRPLTTSAIVFAVTSVVVILLLNNNPPPSSLPESTASLVGNNVIQQSLSNFRGVVSGDIKPQIVSNVPDDIRSFFSGKTEFPVLVLAMKHCTLVGAVLNDYSGVSLAHVVYKRDDDVVYMYQTCWETVMAGDKLHLPDDAKAELQQTGWFSEERPDGNTVVIWRNGKTLCAAVARMSKEDLVACLQTDETRQPGLW